MIINLGETLLPSLGIRVVDKKGKKASLVGTLFDNYTKHGLCFDSYGPHAGKTPLGIKVNGELLYRLIGSPESLVDQFIHHGYYKDKKFPQMVSNTRFIYGNKELYDKFLDHVNKQFVTKYAYAKMMLEDLISSHLSLNTLDLSNNKVINHKYQCYTPLHVFIQYLYMMTPMNSETHAFEKIDRLCQYGLIHWSKLKDLKEHVALSNFIRLEHHLKNKEQKVEITKDDKIFPTLATSNKKLQSMFKFFDQNIKQLEIERLKRESALGKKYNMYGRKQLFKSLMEQDTSSKVSPVIQQLNFSK